MPVIEVILVDKDDNPTGKMEKLEVHQKGLMHRAVTVYVFNARGELLLQRRAENKYHCGGLWSNTCCGHPFPGETTQHAAERRLREEMGLSLSLKPAFEISYKLPLKNGLTEHEYGHIFFGVSDAQPELNPQEADAWRYSSLSELQLEIAGDEERFTPWFLYTIQKVIDSQRP
ncbi:isopentenyl-diphosphate Delta-isomerase [Tatumella citrea]|uniref:Isopentenyl-diphosphate Delta-isomerase n=1 Tax=Tatumella citrea TaxID=53336 RepID=A0A1Y0LHB1_TATCI|nr:isopentenyl-diphosphate Delta-isomerase [Tatumella citrea]ARU93464.1 isopentenyl-diphosphate delta-isomerase [Tatumella citrea]ARU97503.1 isopentenyl-diphosphate delta-isomerase [Tatumella citrea]